MKTLGGMPSRRWLAVYAIAAFLGVVAIAWIAASRDRPESDEYAEFVMVQGGIATNWVELRGRASTVFVKHGLASSSAPASIPNTPIHLGVNDTFVQLNGWPFRALYGRYGLVANSVRTSGGLGLGRGRTFRWIDSRQSFSANVTIITIEDAPAVLLPWGVRWTGFAADAAVYWCVLVAGHGLIVGVPSAIIASGRRSRGQCVQCGYDLKGSPGGACPECGAGAGGGG